MGIDDCIQYTVVDLDGSILESRLNKCHASFMNYKVNNASNDRIYESDSKIFISPAKWLNNSAATLPPAEIIFSNRIFSDSEI